MNSIFCSSYEGIRIKFCSYFQVNRIHSEILLPDDMKLLICQIPKIDIWDPLIKHLIEKTPALNCHQNAPPPLTYIYNDSVIMVNETASELNYPNITLEHCDVAFYNRWGELWLNVQCCTHSILSGFHTLWCRKLATPNPIWASLCFSFKFPFCSHTSA